MGQIAYYAPLKSPHHPIPSGDREIAQAVMRALAMNTLGLEVVLASELRSYDGQGDASLQQQIKARAEEEVERLCAAQYNWRAWVTYHNYYKAPDLIGVAVSKRLGIPYLLIEASIAKRRLSGPWSEFAVCADHATSAANVVFYLTERDHVALEQFRPAAQKLVHLAPFLNDVELAPVTVTALANKRLVTVAMHRYGDKFASYRILSEALAFLTTSDWHLTIVGDGPARVDIESMFAKYGDRVAFSGLLDRDAVNACYQQGGVFVWPGVNEAFGMVYLEAQAAGLPVIAEDRIGVREVMATSQSLVPPGEPVIMASAIDAILGSAAQYQSMAQAGHEFVSRRHLLGTAAQTLSQQLSELLA